MKNLFEYRERAIKPMGSGAEIFWAFLTGILAVILSLVWYRERMFHFDAAFYLFQLIQGDAMNFFHDRYIGFLTQVVPLGLHYVGASLKTVARGYSVSLPLVQLAVLVFLYRWKRDGRWLLLFLLVVLTSVRFRFFSPISETHFVLIFSFLYFLFARETTVAYRWQNTAGMAAIFFASISHPIAVVPIIALWGIALITRDRTHWPMRLFELMVILLFFGWRFWMVSANSYESGKMGVLYEIPEIFRELTGLTVWAMMVDYFRHWHLVQWIIFLVMTGWLFARGRVLEAVCGLGFSLLILALVAVTYSYLTFRVHHMFEGYLSFLSLSWMLPAYFLISEDVPRQRYFLLVAVSLFTSLWGISEARQYYVQREDYLEGIWRPWSDKGNKKLVMSVDEFPWTQLWYNWAVPYETLLMTASSDKSSSLSLLVPDAAEKRKLVREESDIFFGPWESIPMHQLDSLYFSFPRQPYLDITGTGLPRDFFQ